MAFAEYDRYDATGLAHLVRRKEVSPLELVDEAIARIDTHRDGARKFPRRLFHQIGIAQRRGA